MQIIKNASVTLLSGSYADIDEVVDYYEIRDDIVRTPDLPQPTNDLHSGHYATVVWEGPAIRATPGLTQEMSGIYPSVVNEGPQISSGHSVIAESSQTERTDNYPIVWEGPAIRA